jgi:Predicted transcriptional regulator
MSENNVNVSIPADADVNHDAVAKVAADIVCAYLSSHDMSPDEIPALIDGVFGAVRRCVTGKAEEPKPEPAVPVKKSVQDDFIICLEDGKKFKSLKRHLRTKYNMTPEEYRAKWGLPADYPMVAPAYARRRSELAKEIGLGNTRFSGRIDRAK